MSRMLGLPLAALIWRQESPPKDTQGDLLILAEGARKLARQSLQSDEKRAFEELAAGAIRLASALPTA